MALPVSFAQTAMDFPLDDDVSTGSEMYATARESSEDEETDDSAYATPRALSISRLHVPGSFQEGSSVLTPMSVQPTQPMHDVGPTSSPEENFPMADLPVHDDDDDMHDQVYTAHRRHIHHLR